MTSRSARTVATWQELIAAATIELGDAHAARVLAEEASGWRPAVLATRLDESPSARATAGFHSMLVRRVAGEPLQHVLGHWSFRRLDVLVDGRALVPRPETEIVVEFALGEIDRLRDERSRTAAPNDAPLRVVDLGTGSGVIALAIAEERSDVEVVAIDRQREALALAGANRARLDEGVARRVRLVESDWYGGLEQSWLGDVAVIVTNPPYLAEHERVDLDPVVRDFDPPSALFAGPTGLEAYEPIVGGAARWLVEGGALVAELAPGQAGALIALARGAGADPVRVEPDLAGRDRVLVARW